MANKKEKGGPTGKAIGGLARAQALTPEQRLQIAKKAAAARWGEKLPRATHRGNFKEEFGFDCECYVLDDEQKTAVISKRGMGVALGLGEGGTRVSAFVRGAKIAPYVGRELTEKLSNPLVFQGPAVGAVPPPIVHGYDVTILIDICHAVITAQAEGRLLRSQAHIAKQAYVIQKASGKAGIQGLVYALAGYDPTRAEVIAAFKFYVREEAREYEREFPDQLYNEWYRLYQLPKPERNRPWKFKNLTIDHVYTPLARSNGKILQLMRIKKAESADRYAKLHQFLAEIGVKALRTHLGQLLGIAQVSEGNVEYERHVERIFGTQQSLDLPEPKPSSPT